MGSKNEGFFSLSLVPVPKMLNSSKTERFWLILGRPTPVGPPRLGLGSGDFFLATGTGTGQGHRTEGSWGTGSNKARKGSRKEGKGTIFPGAPGQAFCLVKALPTESGNNNSCPWEHPSDARIIRRYRRVHVSDAQLSIHPPSPPPPRWAVQRMVQTKNWGWVQGMGLGLDQEVKK